MIQKWSHWRGITVFLVKRFWHGLRQSGTIFVSVITHKILRTIRQMADFCIARYNSNGYTKWFRMIYNAFGISPAAAITIGMTHTVSRFHIWHSLSLRGKYLLIRTAAIIYVLIYSFKVSTISEILFVIVRSVSIFILNYYSSLSLWYTEHSDVFKLFVFVITHETYYRSVWLIYNICLIDYSGYDLVFNPRNKSFRLY